MQKTWNERDHNIEYVLCRVGDFVLLSVTHPSSLKTVWIVDSVVRYLLGILMGCGPWMRLLATSKGMLAKLERDPAKKPKSSRSGIEFCIYWIKENTNQWGVLNLQNL